jgi:hypothetical protein
MKTSALLPFALGALWLTAAPTHAPAAAEPTVASARLDLLDVLVQNGLITREQAAAVAANQPAAPAAVRPLAKTVSKLSLGGRVQAQFAALSGDQDGTGDPADTAHFLLRRVYLMTKAELGPEWRAQVTYNFANSLFDVATVQWGNPDLSIDVGYRMVNLGREQRTFSGMLKAIERSVATRYFVEADGNNNGLDGGRLGAGSYRVGVFADGKAGEAFWGAAITNPEQPTSLAALSGSGGAANNRPAVWLNGGVNLRSARSLLVVGTGLGWLPDQGGRVAGQGDDLTVGTAYADYVAGRFSLLAEVFGGLVAGGAIDGADSFSTGVFVQPSWAFTPALEGVFRIGYLDTDGRGVTLRDAIPSAPLTAASDRIWDFFAGGTWYIKGHDLKIQAGLIFARGEDTPAGADAQTETYGFRSQMQVNF